MPTYTGRIVLLLLLLVAGAIGVSAQDFLAWSSTNHLPGVQIISGLFAGQRAIVLKGPREAFQNVLICYTDEVAAQCEAAPVFLQRVYPAPQTPPAPAAPLDTIH